MKSIPKLIASAVLLLAAVWVPELSICPPAHAESEASSSAGSEPGLEAGVTGRGRRRGGRRAYWRRMNEEANKLARKEEEQYRAKQWTGDHH